MFSPLRKKRYSDQIAEQIQQMILSNHLETGTVLPSEQELASEFQVSRSVIREALRILEMFGLVSIKKGPTGGIFVSNGYGKPIKESLSNMIASGDVTIDHLFDVRMLIEPHIAMEAALRAQDEHLKKLEHLFSESFSNLDDVALLKRNNLNFHLLLAKASGNPVLSILLQSVINLLIELSFDFLDPSYEQQFLKDHNEIFLAIREKKPKKAKTLVEKDVLFVWESLKKFKSSKNT